MIVFLKKILVKKLKRVSRLAFIELKIGKFISVQNFMSGRKLEKCLLYLYSTFCNWTSNFKALISTILFPAKANKVINIYIDMSRRLFQLNVG